MKKLIYFFVAILTIVNFYSCKEQDEVYKEFVKLSGTKYPQKADSLKVISGYNRLRVTWLKSMDPSVISAKVYWNNYLDSINVDLKNSPDTINVDIQNLVEGTYTFYVKTYDANGNVSIISEATGTSYGDIYTTSVVERSIDKLVRDADKTGTISWGAASADILYTQVRYITNDGTTNTLTVLPTETATKCYNAKPGEVIEYRSIFKPSNGMDAVTIDWRKSDTPFLYEFPRDKWTAEARNGNHDWGDGGGGFPYQVFDGNTATGWHSKVGAEFPQVFAIDAQETSTFTSFKIIPPATTNWRYLVTVKIYISDTKLPADEPDASWGEPVITTTYDGSSEFVVDLPSATTGRYIAIVFPDSKSGSPYISFMEFYGYGY